jgi:precorrin-6x reductase
MTDVIQSGKSDAQRIADRLKGSNDHSTAETIAHHGTGPTRTITTVHRSGHQHQHGPAHSGEGNIVGGKR